MANKFGDINQPYKKGVHGQLLTIYHGGHITYFKVFEQNRFKFCLFKDGRLNRQQLRMFDPVFACQTKQDDEHSTPWYTIIHPPHRSGSSHDIQLLNLSCFCYK